MVAATNSGCLYMPCSWYCSTPRFSLSGRRSCCVAPGSTVALSQSVSCHPVSCRHTDVPCYLLILNRGVRQMADGSMTDLSLDRIRFRSTEIGAESKSVPHSVCSPCRAHFKSFSCTSTKPLKLLVKSVTRFSCFYGVFVIGTWL